MADVALQRKNMVESQVRPSDITDRRIIRAMLEVPREAFVPASRASVAYGDADIRLKDGAAGSPQRVMMPARVLAKLLQVCAIESHDDVLIVGAGLGYSSAIVAQLAKSVTALEEDEALAAQAKKTLEVQGITQADVHQGPLIAGCPSKAPFDVIIVEGAVERIPQALLDQLGLDGRLVAITAQGAAGKATLWHRHAAGTTSSEVFDATAAILPGFAKAPEFSF